MLLSQSLTKVSAVRRTILRVRIMDSFAFAQHVVDVLDSAKRFTLLRCSVALGIRERTNNGL